MFLRIDNLQPLTEAWARDRAEVGKWSSNGRLITESWFKEGLRPFSITRDLKWGVPVPVKGMEDKVLYVWFDAPIGYPSITACYTDEWEQWWKNPDNVRLYQFMGKVSMRAFENQERSRSGSCFYRVTRRTTCVSTLSSSRHVSSAVRIHGHFFIT